MTTKGTPGPIPNRWLHCPRKSEQFIAEKFIAFKTPLSDKFKDQVPLDCSWPPEMIFGYMKMLKVKLGLWIDLTNTKRFYDREIVENRGCRYVKLQCKGHGETPSPEQTQSFIEIVDEFINERPFDIIGVHCTHGFNRTGFLIISYMVERLDCSVEAALNAFAQARPPGIYKQAYIKELFRRYDDEEEAPTAPALPDWCLEYDDGPGSTYNGEKHKLLEEKSSSSTINNDVDGDDDDENDVVTDGTNKTEYGNSSSSSSVNQTDGPPKKKKRKEAVKKDATFMSGVSGVSLFLEQPKLSNLQQKIQDMCEWTSSGFPGSQPVSMDQNNLNNLHTKPYRVSWKADGTRYMMLINKKDEIYFFDRDFACFQVENITFPNRKNLNQHLTDTLLDGEMVIDKVQDRCIPRYLVYDIIRYENNDVGKLPFFPDRLKCIKKEIIEPRYEAMKRGIINRALEPFSVRDKEFWEITQAAALLSPKFAQKLTHEPDGLIFQPSAEAYTPGQSPDVLKWKPVSLNSVDFKLKISEESGVGILNKKIGLLYVGGLDVPFAKIKYTKILKDLDNKIIECKFENNQWIFMRQRTDKSYPNSYNTAMAVCNSIQNPVTAEILLDFIHRYRFCDDNEIMPPPPPHRQYQ